MNDATALQDHADFQGTLPVRYQKKIKFIPFLAVMSLRTAQDCEKEGILVVCSLF